MNRVEAVSPRVWWWLSREDGETTRQGLSRLAEFQTPINFHSDLNVDAAFSIAILKLCKYLYVLNKCITTFLYFYCE
jgi:hypothetical protein